MAEFIHTGVGGLGTRASPKKPSGKSPARVYERHELMPPPRPSRDFIPTSEMVEALVSRALSALAKGIYWDRGSIINVVL